MDASDKVTPKLLGSSEVLKNTMMYGQGGDQLLLEDLPTLNHQVLEYWTSLLGLAIVEFLNQNMAIVQGLLGSDFEWHAH